MRYRASVAISLCLSALLLSGRAVCDGKEAAKIKAAGIQVAMIQSDEISVPEEFRVALYENLIRQLEKRGFQHVYRDGDRNAAGAADLVVLHSTVRRFKAGSEKARQVSLGNSGRVLRVTGQMICRRPGPRNGNLESDGSLPTTDLQLKAAAAWSRLRIA
jgi:hypothetical protein